MDLTLGFFLGTPSSFGLRDVTRNSWPGYDFPFR